jgi:hypothetical protein
VRSRRCVPLLLVLMVVCACLGVAPAWGSAGSSWSTAQHVDGLRLLSGVSCASASFCVAVDSSGNALTWSGKAWSKPTDIDGAEPLTGVSCASASFCVAIDAAGNVLTLNGGHWSAPTSVTGPGDDLTGVSCASASFCVAVDVLGNAFSWNGSAWSAPEEIDPAATPGDVSCPSRSFCVAVDNAGNALTWNGSTWSAPSSIDGVNAFYGVSCTAATFCVAVDGAGHALTWSEGMWRTRTLFSAPDDGYPAGVSCASGSFCSAVALQPATSESTQKTFAWNGREWLTLPLQLTDIQAYPGFVSCVSASFCAAVGGWDALIYRGGGLASPATGKIYFWVDLAAIIDAPGQTPAPEATRPPVIGMTQDGSWFIEDLHWSHWGSPTAVATGTSSASNGIPNIAEGKRIKKPAKVTLSKPGSFQGHRVYRCFALTISSHPAADQHRCLKDHNGYWSFG